MTTVEVTSSAGVSGAVGSSDGPIGSESSDRSVGSNRSWDRPRGARRVGRYALLVLVAVIVIFPVYTTVVAAISPTQNVLDGSLVPRGFTVQPLLDAWNEGRLGRYLFNSTVVAAVVTFGQIASSLLSGYAFAHLDFPARTPIFVAFIATLLVPFEATVVVNIRTVESLGDFSGVFGGVNSIQALAIPFLATAVGTFLVRQALLALPSDLRDAARIDGLGHLGYLRHVALPLVRPTLAALGLFAFLSTWNQYLWPRQIITDDDRHTVQSGLRLLGESTFNRPNLVMAGTVIAAIPIMLVLIFFQRQLVRGLTAGAVKG